MINATGFGNRRFLLRALTLLTLIAVSAGVWAVRSILWPYVMAAVLAYLLQPVVSYLQRHGVRRETAVNLVFVVTLALFSWWIFEGVQALVNLAPELARSVPQALERLEKLLGGWDEQIHRWFPAIKPHWVLERIHGWATGPLEVWAESVPDHLVAGVEMVFNLFMIPFAGYFFLRGGPGFFQSLLNACPGRSVEKFLSLLHASDTVLGDFTRGVLVEAAMIGLLMGLGFRFIGVQHSAVLGLVSGVANLVPYMGPWLGGMFGLGVALSQVNPPHLWDVVLLSVAVHMFDGWIFQPILFHRAVRLHPVLLMLSLTCGLKLGGVVGFILAVPTACVIKEFVVVLADWYRSERGIATAYQEAQGLLSRPLI